MKAQLLPLFLLLGACGGGGGGSDPTPPQNPINRAPIADVAADPVRGTVPLEVAFDASGSRDPDGSITSYSWDFGDGNVGSGRTINHTYEGVGTFTAAVTVRDNKGSIDTDSVRINVEANPPTASFSATPEMGTAPLQVSFDASASTDSDGSIEEYTWDFGDDTVGSGETIEHTYEELGDFTVTLTVKDNHGATGAATHTISVKENQPPVAAFTWTNDPDVPLKIYYDATESYDPDGEIVSYHWDLDPEPLGWGDTKEGEKVSLVYTQAGDKGYWNSRGVQNYDPNNLGIFFWEPGEVTVTLTVTDDEGLKHTLSQAVELATEHWFPGQRAMVEHVQSYGLYGKAGMFDGQETQHGKNMLSLLRMNSTPDEVSMFHTAPRLRPDAAPNAVAIGIPVLLALRGIEDSFWQERDTTVVVSGVGNMNNVRECYDIKGSADDRGDRDVWNPAHPFWDNCQLASGGKPYDIDDYNKTMAALATGKAIVASSVQMKNDEQYEVQEGVWSCGDTMEYCFLVPQTNASSNSTAILTAVMYYLMQMHDTAEEAVEALKSCTKDIVDREYGQGVVDLRCTAALMPVVERPHLPYFSP